MHAIVVRCPQCNASLKVDDARSTTRCEYCGTEAQVQRRTAFGMKVELPKDAPRNLPVAVEAARRVMVWVGASSAFVIMLVVFVFLRSGASRIVSMPVISNTMPAVPRMDVEPPTMASASSPAKAGWNGGGEPVFVDVNGDGARDAVGLVRYVIGGDHMNVGAVDARTGKLVWESETLGTYTEVYQGRLSAVGAKLLFAHPRGELWAFEARTGVRAWMRQLGERVKSVCELGGGGYAIALANNQWLDLELGTGQITPRKRPSGCKPLRNTDDDEPHGGPDVSAASGVGGVAGMDRGEAMSHAASGVIVVSGSRTPGTSVPMLARMVDKKPAWKVEVPSEDVMNARAERFCVSGDRACSVYDTDKSGVRITCFAAADGTRAWDQVLGETHVVIRGLADVDGTVFLSTWGKLFALDGATGKPRYVFGH